MYTHLAKPQNPINRLPSTYYHVDYRLFYNLQLEEMSKVKFIRCTSYEHTCGFT